MFYRTDVRYVPQDILDLLNERDKLENRISDINLKLKERLEEL
jgi:hypothetical protein